jgi:hypothetical protein
MDEKSEGKIDNLTYMLNKMTKKSILQLCQSHKLGHDSKLKKLQLIEYVQTLIPDRESNLYKNISLSFYKQKLTSTRVYFKNGKVYKFRFNIYDNNLYNLCNLKFLNYIYVYPFMNKIKVSGKLDHVDRHINDIFVLMSKVKLFEFQIMYKNIMGDENQSQCKTELYKHIYNPDLIDIILKYIYLF